MSFPQNWVKLLIKINNSTIGNCIMIQREYSSMLYLCHGICSFLNMNTGAVHEKRNFGSESDWELSSDRNDPPVNTVYRPLTRYHLKLKRLLSDLIEFFHTHTQNPEVISSKISQNSSSASLFELQRPISNKSSVGLVCPTICQKCIICSLDKKSPK